MRYFCLIFGISIRFRMFWKKWPSEFKYFWSYWLRKMCLFKSIAGLYSEKPLGVNVLTSSKNFWNQLKSTYILLFHYSEPNGVRKSYFRCDLRFKDFLITGWLRSTSILIVIKRIYHYQLKANYLKNHKFFALYLFNFWN